MESLNDYSILQICFFQCELLIQKSEERKGCCQGKNKPSLRYLVFLNDVFDVAHPMGNVKSLDSPFPIGDPDLDPGNPPSCSVKQQTKCFYCQLQYSALEAILGVAFPSLSSCPDEGWNIVFVDIHTSYFLIFNVNIHLIFIKDSPKFGS